MGTYRHGSHTVFMIHLYIVWITKYRKQILQGDVAYRLRELIREICRKEQVEITKGHVSKDHIHLFASIPLRKQYWYRHLLARGYFCCSSGNVTDDVIKEYIERQCHQADVDFKIEGETSLRLKPA